MSHSAYRLSPRQRQSCLSLRLQHYYRFHTPPLYYNHIYVKADADGDGNGTSWNNAFNDINQALSAAAASRNYYHNSPDVRVAAGIYYGDTNNNQAFSILQGINVYGSFAGNEPPDFDLSQRDFIANATILDGLMNRQVLVQTSSFSSIDSAAWEGFTIRHGYSYNSGGGVCLLDNGSPRNSIVDSCFSENDGGGIYSSRGTILNCTVSHCATASYGNGIYDYVGRVENTSISFCKPLYSYYSNYGAIYAYNDTIIRLSVSDYSIVPLSSLSNLFNDTLSFHYGENIIPFSQPFFYNGNDNLVIPILDSSDNNDDYYSSYFKIHPTNSYQSILFLNYNSPIDFDNDYSYILDNRNNITLLGACDPNACPKPLLILSSLTDSSATITSQNSAGIASQLQFKSYADPFIPTSLPLIPL